MARFHTSPSYAGEPLRARDDVRRTTRRPPGPTPARGRPPTAACARGRGRGPRSAGRRGGGPAARDAGRRRAPDAPVAHQRGEVEGALADERLGVDRQPGPARGAQDVAAVEVLMEEDRSPLSAPVASSSPIQPTARSSSPRSKGRPWRSQRAGSSSAQRRASPASVRSGWPADGGGADQRRRSTAAACRSARASSATLHSCSPGTQRSTSSARRSGSDASSRTAPAPSQCASAAASCSLSGSGKLTLRTAGAPSARVTGATYEIVAGSNGAPGSRSHRAQHSATSRGSRASHSAPPGRDRHHPRPAGTRGVDPPSLRTPAAGAGR